MNIFKNGYFLIFIGAVLIWLSTFLIGAISYIGAFIGLIICIIGVLRPANNALQKQISDSK